MNSLQDHEIDDDMPLVSPKKISRDELMTQTSELICLLHRRTTSRRFKPSQHDTPRLAYARATIAAIQAYAALLRDEEIENLKGRIDALERLKGLKEEIKNDRRDTQKKR